MDKKEIAAFFDKCALWWDADMVRKEDVIVRILDNGGIKAGVHVLDVACGTGVLFPDYLKRGAESVTGIDISAQMVKIAAAKFPQCQVICGDVEETDFGRQFDCVMVYNAFPHFPEPEKLIEKLAQLVRPGGKVSIAHGMSREEILRHHENVMSVSRELPPAEEVADRLKDWFEVDTVLSDGEMYQVAGTRKIR